MLVMNKPEWAFIVIGCLACLCNGGIQPVFGFILSKLTAVHFFSFCSHLYMKTMSFCEGLSRMRRRSSKKASFALYTSIYWFWSVDLNNNISSSTFLCLNDYKKIYSAIFVLYRVFYLLVQAKL